MNTAKLQQYRMKKNHHQSGFTLIEIMVSISIFAIIMVTGIGALLTITRSYQTSREQANVTNSVHFALDSMVRDIRIGDSYFADEFVPQSEFGEEYRYYDGMSNVLNIMGIPGRGQLRYIFNESSEPYLTRYQNIDGDSSEHPLLTEFRGIDIDRALFRVAGSNPADNIQPSVFIYIRGVDEQTGGDFILQTFVSQRNPDFD